MFFGANKYLLNLCALLIIITGCDSNPIPSELADTDNGGVSSPAATTSDGPPLETDLTFEIPASEPQIGAALAFAPRSTRFFQITDRWQRKELLSDDTSILAYANSNENDPSSHWSTEHVVDEWFRIRNRENGHYIHLQPLDGTLRLDEIDSGAWSSQWRFTKLGDFELIENRWQTSHRLHVQQQNGRVQHGPLAAGNWSTQWIFTDVKPVPVSGNENNIGQWSELIEWPLVPLHAALTNDGRVMTYGTDGEGRQGGQFIYDVWNPTFGTGPDSHATLSNTTGTDLFCSAQTLLPGTDDMLLTGGDTRGLNTGVLNRGVTDANIFNSANNTLVASEEMSFPRWYPTLTTLPNGEILVQGGVDVVGRAVETPEIFNPSTSTWRQLEGASSFLYGSAWWYPRSWVAPNGNLLGIGGGIIYEIDIESDSFIDRGRVRGGNFGITSTSVMYRPGRILQIGGGSLAAGGSAEDASALVTEYILDENSPTIRLEVNERASLKYPRHWANATVLPDGQVLVTGGSAAANTLRGVATAAEIFNPDTNTWTTGPNAIHDRLYHSIALLLPDASVLVAGGGAPGADDGMGNFQSPHLNAEIYYPPYFFNNDNTRRQLDKIVTVPESITWNQDFNITPPNNLDVSQVNLLRAGTVTHSNNMEQRLIPLDFTVSGNNTLNVTAPAHPNLAPPGYYLLFVVDAEGIPTEGKMISLGGTFTELETTLSESDGPWFQITDRWRGQELHMENNAGSVQYGEASTDQISSHWTTEPIGGTDFVRIKNRLTGEYMHIQTNNGLVAAGDVPEGFWSSQWRIEPAGAFNFIFNRWITNQRIHVQTSTTEALHGNLAGGNWTTQWRFTQIK